MYGLPPSAYLSEGPLPLLAGQCLAVAQAMLRHVKEGPVEDAGLLQELLATKCVPLHQTGEICPIQANTKLGLRGKHNF